MRSIISLISFTALALLVTCASANAVVGTSSVDELRTAQERAQLQARQTKGGAQHLLLMKRQRISDLIDRLERGKSVDPTEIDELLQGQESVR